METKSKSLTTVNAIITIIEWEGNKDSLLLDILIRRDDKRATIWMSESELGELQVMIDNYLNEKQFKADDKR